MDLNRFHSMIKLHVQFLNKYYKKCKAVIQTAFEYSISQKLFIERNTSIPSASANSFTPQFYLQQTSFKGFK